MALANRYHGRCSLIQKHHDLDKLKILAISDAAPSRNGAGAYYQDLVELLSDHVQHIELYSPVIDEEGNWHAGFQLPLPGDRTQKLCLPNIFRLNRSMDEIKPDVVLIATPGLYGLTGAFLATRKGIPFLLGMHTSFEQLSALYWPDSIRGKVVEKIFNLSNSYLFKRTERVLVNAEPILEEALKMGAPDVRLIGTPIASTFVRQEIVPYSGKLERVLFAGRLAKEKNIGVLLDAVRALPDLQFTIAGDGPLREEVEAAALALPNLHYAGWLNRQQLYRTIDAHDVLVLPSHFETFGTIALEAMARARLVVVSTGCGISRWDSLRDGFRIIEAGSDLTAELNFLQRMSPARRKEQACQARERALQLNNHVLGNWMQILAETLRRLPEDEEFMRDE